MAHTPQVSPNWPGLTVAVINYNGIDVLKGTFDALRHADYPDLKLMMIDDQSTDASVEFVRKNFPQVAVTVVDHSKRKPSVPRNLALRLADTPYLMLLDNDIALQPDCLKRLMRVMMERPNTFRVVPRLVYHDKPDTIYIDGGGLHYLAISARSDRGRTVAEVPALDPIRSIGCGIPLLNREAALKLGGFDEGYFFGWGEDAELIVRARMKGFDAWTVQDAIGLHVEKEHGTLRAEAQFYNRYRLMLINYSLRGLLLLSPAFFVFDLMLLVMGFMKGLSRLQVRAIRRLFRDRRDILTQRRIMQQRRAIGDASLLEGTPLVATGILKQSKLIRLFATLASGFFVAYWRMVRPFLGDEPFEHRSRGAATVPNAAANTKPANTGVLGVEFRDNTPKHAHA